MKLILWILYALFIKQEKYRNLFINCGQFSVVEIRCEGTSQSMARSLIMANRHWGLIVVQPFLGQGLLFLFDRWGNRCGKVGSQRRATQMKRRLGQPDPSQLPTAPTWQEGHLAVCNTWSALPTDRPRLFWSPFISTSPSDPVTWSGEPHQLTSSLCCTFPNALCFIICICFCMIIWFSVLPLEHKLSEDRNSACVCVCVWLLYPWAWHIAGMGWTDGWTGTQCVGADVATGYSESNSSCSKKTCRCCLNSPHCNFSSLALSVSGC